MYCYYVVAILCPTIKNKTPISFGALTIIFFIYVIIFYHQFDDSNKDLDFGISPNPSANKA